MLVHGSGVAPVNCEPGVTRKVLAHSPGVMMCEFSFLKGARGNVHAHPHEQVSYVAKGSFLFRVGDAVTRVSAGDSVLIPSGVEHGVEALQDAMLVDVFTPRRDDFL